MTDPLGLPNTQHSGYYVNNHTEAENKQFTTVFAEITDGFKQAMLEGLTPETEEVQDLVRRHYEFCLKFWKPDRDSYPALALSYILPSPYRDSYEVIAEGLGKFHYDAIVHFSKTNL